MNLVELIVILLVTTILAGMGVSAGSVVTQKARELEREEREIEARIEQMLGGDYEWDMNTGSIEYTQDTTQETKT